MTTTPKIEALRASLEQLGKVAIAFSGGVDSTFLLLCARELLGRENVLAVTAKAPNFPPDESNEAMMFCMMHDVRHIIANASDDLESVMFENAEDRCYHCKKTLFGKMKNIAGDFVLCDGTNADDEADYRPGTRALRELGITSPLKEAGLTKAEIRAELKERNIPVWNKPAYACLASRIPYGEPATLEKFEAVFRVEKKVRSLGFTQVRLRHHGDIGRLEILPEERDKLISEGMLDRLNGIIKDAGFKYACLDLGGYSMGSLNKQISEGIDAQTAGE